jgi:hypothetical protein
MLKRKIPTGFIFDYSCQVKHRARRFRRPNARVNWPELSVI